MATITSDTFLDGGVARTAGETWTINGGVLTIRTDTRWHANAPASMTGSIGATTISSTLGGGVMIDARNVRWLAYNNGSGNVPAIGTDITQAGVTSSYLLGVYASLDAAPTAVGAAMPATGFIKFREVAGTFAAGALTGIGADATGADVTGWIEVVQRRSVANTVPRLGFFRTRGDWFYLDNTNGSAGQVIQVPTNGGGAGTHVPAVWIETGVGTDVYEIFPAVLNTWFITANLGTDERSKIVETIGNGQIRIGNNGTDNVGFVPPSGCRVRIPNILGRQSTSAGGDANNQVPNTTIADRPDFTTTSSGEIDMEYLMDDWYHLFSTPYVVRHINCATFDILSTNNNAAPIVVDNFATGNYLGNQISLTLTSNSLGGTVSNSKFIRGTAATNGDACALTTSNDYVISNCHFGVLAYARSSGYSIDFSQCLNIAVNNCYQYNSYVRIVTSFQIRVNDLDHCDRFVGSTNATSGIYCVSVLTSSDDVIVDGVTFGLQGTISNVNPYLAPFYAINSSNITFRNAGTRAAPLSCNSGFAPQYAVQDGGVCTNLKAQRIFLEATRTNLYLDINTSKNFTFENVHGSVGAVQTLSLNTLAKGIRATSNSVTGGAAVYGSHYFDMFTSDTTGRLWFAMNEQTAFSENNIETTFGVGAGFTSAGQVSMPNVSDQLIFTYPYFILGHTGFDGTISPVATGTNPANFSYEYDLDTGAGFTNTFNNLFKVKIRASGGGVGTSSVTVAATNSPMPEVGDLVLTELGTHLPVGTTVSNVVGNVISFDNTIAVAIGTNLPVYFVNSIVGETISAANGFKFKLRMTTTDAATTNAITYVRINTTSSLAAQGDYLYSLDSATVTLENVVVGSRYEIYNSTTSTLMASGTASGSTVTVTVLAGEGDVLRIRVRKASAVTKYLPFGTQATVTSGTASAFISQVEDAVALD